MPLHNWSQKPIDNIISDHIKRLSLFLHLQAFLIFVKNIKPCQHRLLWSAVPPASCRGLFLSWTAPARCYSWCRTARRGSRSCHSKKFPSTDPGFAGWSDRLSAPKSRRLCCTKDQSYNFDKRNFNWKYSNLERAW